MSCSKLFRSFAIILSAVALVSASPKPFLCSTAEIKAAPTEDYIVEIPVFNKTQNVTWTALPNVGTSLTSLHARAVRSKLGTVTVEYVFKHNSSAPVAYDWEVYQTNSTAASPAKTLYTGEVEETFNLTGSINAGLFILCVFDTGAKNVLVGVELDD